MIVGTDGTGGGSGEVAFSAVRFRVDRRGVSVGGDPCLDVRFLELSTFPLPFSFRLGVDSSSP